MSIGRTDAEAETPILWPPDVKVKEKSEKVGLKEIQTTAVLRQRHHNLNMSMTI